MLLLTATTHSLEVITSSGEDIDVTVSYVDITSTTFSPASTQTNITTATTTSILAAPAASTQRQVKFLSITNIGASTNNITVQKDVSGTNYIIIQATTLAAGDSLQYTDGEGWKILDSTGGIKTSSGGSSTLADGDYGDITVASSGTVWTIDTPGVVTLAATDKILLKDTSVADAMGYVAATNIASQATSVGTLTVGTWNASPIDLASYVTGSLPVTNGGTGRASGAVAYGLVATGTTATGVQQTISPGTSGTLLQGAGGAALATWTTATYPSTVSTIGSWLRSDGTNFVSSTVTWFADTCARGDLVVGRTTNNIKFLAIGTSGQFLTNDGTDIAWSTATIPSTATSTGKILVADGTNWVASTPTFPNASATSRKIIVSDGTNWTASTETYATPGSSGNVLTSDGTNWTSAAPSSGSWVLISTGTASSSATIDFTGLSSTYAAYQIQIYNLLPATNAVEFWMRYSTDNGSTFISTTTYDGVYQGQAATLAGGRIAAVSAIHLMDSSIFGTLSNTAGLESYYVVNLSNPSSTTENKKVLFFGNTLQSTTTSGFMNGCWRQQSTTAVNAIRFMMSSGNIATGTFKLYALKA